MQTEADQVTAILADTIVNMMELMDNKFGQGAGTQLTRYATALYESKHHQVPELKQAEDWTPPVADDAFETMLERFLAKGGYPLRIADVYLNIQKDDIGTKKAMAFGIAPEGKLVFLLSSGHEVAYGLRELMYHSTPRKALYGDGESITFFPDSDTGAGFSEADVKRLITDLGRVSANHLANAIERLYVNQATIVTDDVPKQQLVGMSQEERDGLTPIPGVKLNYMGENRDILRINPVDGGWVFHTPHESVQVSGGTVEVTHVLETGFSLLTVTSAARLGGVSLDAVLGSSGVARDHYQSIIAIFEDAVQS